MRRLLPSAPLLLGLLAGGTLHVHDEVSAEGIERVKVHWAGGTVHIRASAEETARARAVAWGPEAPTAFGAHVDGELMTLELLCRYPVPCGGDLELRVSPGVQVELDLGEGSAILEGPMGDISVFVGEGSISGRGLGSRSAVLQVVYGAIDATWDVVPQRIVLATVRGDAVIEVPNAAYRFEDQAERANLIGLEAEPEAERSISFTTVGGKARIVGRRPDLAVASPPLGALAAL